MDELIELVIKELMKQGAPQGAFIHRLPNEPTIRYDGLIAIDDLINVIRDAVNKDSRDDPQD